MVALSESEKSRLLSLKEKKITEWVDDCKSGRELHLGFIAWLNNRGIFNNIPGETIKGLAQPAIQDEEAKTVKPGPAQSFVKLMQQINHAGINFWFPFSPVNQSMKIFFDTFYYNPGMQAAKAADQMTEHVLAPDFKTPVRTK
ncbi:MAG: hypothetical protein A2857_06895 [Candidatus Levybacteria bacterium RIFCSPHIGHO2_01_FULL_36_15]|nr:MAG: hypothetical protein A2857_06895 [Candidatus Levybacteria bacterium RIFCSPHIGHO2_01_FULL_36_15]OGH38660.1 MAG: hypothetical protein A2905_04225 [Candidatus Levybacteria bacterium RIFCSPLOWO2_01_FULL_36_10]